MEYHGKANFTLRDYLYVNLTLEPKRYLAYGMLSLLICFCMLISVWKNDPMEQQIASTILFFLALTLSMILGEILLLLWRYKRNPNLTGEREFLLSDDGIQIKRPTEQNTGLFPWDRIQGRLRRRGFWLLKISEKHSLIVPLSAFPKENQEAISLLIEGKTANINQ